MPMQKELAVIDLEWARNAEDGKDYPIEIAILNLQVVSGQWQITHEWHSLINPDISIPLRIQELTGIQSADLLHAPRFQDLIPQIELYTKNCVLVAHNAEKDEQCLVQSYQRCGLSFKRAKICTHELALREWPELKAYDLTSLSGLIGKPLEAAHNALADARACFEIFKRLSLPPKKNEFFLKNLSLRDLFPHLKKNYRWDDFPLTTGVFSLYSENELLYIAEAFSMRKKIISFIANHNALLSELEETKPLTEIRFVSRPHELANIILCETVKLRFKPLLNLKLDQAYPFALYSYKDAKGISQFKIRNLQPKRFPCDLFVSKKKGIDLLKKLPAMPKGELSPNELKRVNNERSLVVNGLRLPYDNMIIKTKQDDQEEVVIRDGRIESVIYQGKTRSIKESPLQRKLLLQKLNDIRTRKDHHYLFEQPKKTIDPSSVRPASAEQEPQELHRYEFRHRQKIQDQVSH